MHVYFPSIIFPATAVIDTGESKGPHFKSTSLSTADYFLPSIVFSFLSEENATLHGECLEYVVCIK